MVGMAQRDPDEVFVVQTRVSQFMFLHMHADLQLCRVTVS